METVGKTINIRLMDGTVQEVPEGSVVSELLSRVMSKKKAKEVLLVRIKDGSGAPVLKDLSFRLEKDCELDFVTASDADAIDVLRHTTAHVMAQAVKELFPDVKVAIGPAIENGFYYDFDYKKGFTPEDLAAIELRMQEIIQGRQTIVRKSMSIEDARAYMEQHEEVYKLQILDELASQGEKMVSFYGQGGFWDLCRGPHLPDTGFIPAFKLTHTAGAYWRGDEKQPMLQRIYGTAFFSAKELKAYLDMLEEAKRRDHRRLGRELELFAIDDSIGPGLILWQPKGALMRKTIEDFWRSEHLRRGYELLYTPHIARRDLWKTSGHLDFYFESMYAPMDIDEVQYQLKPMNCPFHIAIYNIRKRSYRELPLRWCELGTVYRYERTGTLHGLMRVRGFTQDDAHIFCTKEQLNKEIGDILAMTLYVLRVFGFHRYDVYLSTRPEKYVGTDENWERATNALKQALEAQGLPYSIDPGEGVFYGPKIDIKIKDCLNRSWQCSTIQVDFNLPERFNVRYVGEDGEEHAPIMIHRALMGSLERFFGVLIEHYAGAFPMWLAPVQAVVLTVTDRSDAWASHVVSELQKAGFRVSADLRNEKLGKKVREAQLAKIPFMLVIGDSEVQGHTVTPRTRKGDSLEPMSVNGVIDLFNKEIQTAFDSAVQ